MEEKMRITEEGIIFRDEYQKTKEYKTYAKFMQKWKKLSESHWLDITKSLKRMRAIPLLQGEWRDNPLDRYDYYFHVSRIRDLDPGAAIHRVSEKRAKDERLRYRGTISGLLWPMRDSSGAFEMPEWVCSGPEELFIQLGKHFKNPRNQLGNYFMLHPQGFLDYGRIKASRESRIESYADTPIYSLSLFGD
jgi:hypothetical protein